MSIQEAKRRYPIGTKFSPAHLDAGTCIITNTNFEIVGNGDIYALTNEGDKSGFDEKYGESWSRLVYEKCTNKWAKIIELGKPFKFEVVYCKTKEEWDFVLSKIGNPALLNDKNFQAYPEVVICFKSNPDDRVGCYGSKSYHDRDGNRTITFEEWCIEFGNTFGDDMPEYVECFQVWNGTSKSVVGKIYKTSEKNDFSCHTFRDIWEGVVTSRFKDYFKPATKEAYEAQFKKVPTEYPVEVKSEPENGLKLLKIKKLEIKFVD